MHDMDIADLTSKASLLMLRFEQRCQALEPQHHALARDVRHLAQQVPQVVKQSLDDALRSLPEQVRDKVDSCLLQTIDDYQRRLQAAGQAVQQRADHVGQQLMRLEQLHRLLVWKVLGATATAFGLLLAGGLWLSTHYANIIRDNQLSAETVQAYNAADLVPCGEGLCANVDIKGQRYGKYGEYLPVKRH